MALMKEAMGSEQGKKILKDLLSESTMPGEVSGPLCDLIDGRLDVDTARRQIFDNALDSFNAGRLDAKKAKKILGCDEDKNHCGAKNA